MEFGHRGHHVTRAKGLQDISVDMLGFDQRLQPIWFVISITAAMLVSGCNRSAEVRYRVTVEVNDRGVVRSGSSVWAFTLSKSVLPLASAYNPRFRGEAVAVDLPGRGTLFALLSETGKMYPENLFGDFRRPRSGPPRFASRVEDLRHVAGLIGTSADLNCTNPPWLGVQCPQMVRFRDIAKPNTVEEVKFNDLPSAFGRGVSLKRVRIEITDADVTTGIGRRLGWLPLYYDRRLDGERYGKGTSVANGLSSGTFSTEVSK